MICLIPSIQAQLGHQVSEIIDRILRNCIFSVVMFVDHDSVTVQTKELTMLRRTLLRSQLVHDPFDFFKLDVLWSLNYISDFFLNL